MRHVYTNWHNFHVLFCLIFFNPAQDLRFVALNALDVLTNQMRGPDELKKRAWSSSAVQDWNTESSLTRLTWTP